MTITLTPDQERTIQEAIQAGLVRSMDEFIETAIEALPHRENTSPSRGEAVRRMQKFAERYRLSLGEPITREFLHEGHRC
jgi:Arc/MetJ-type ribon-helix-helix transcriptional regulator